MNEMNVPEPDYKHLASIIEFDVALTYKILKLVNSNFTGNDISSIQHALSYMGIEDIRKWLSLAMVQNMGNIETSELIITSMIRSHMLESIAKHSNMKKHTDELTLIGVLSILDVILEQPMAELIDALPLTADVRNTLLGENSIYSDVFRLCISYEKGEFKKLDTYCSKLDYDSALLPQHYLNAVRWADKTFEFLHQEI